MNLEMSAICADSNQLMAFLEEDDTKVQQLRQFNANLQQENKILFEENRQLKNETVSHAHLSKNSKNSQVQSHTSQDQVSSLMKIEKL